MKIACRILVLEDNPGDLRLLREMLREADDFLFELRAVTRLMEALALLESTGFDLIVADLNVPDSRGLDTFNGLKDAAPEVPMILVTGERDRALALDAMANGAQDCLSKNELDSRSLVRSILYSLERNRGSAERRQLVAIIEATPDIIWTATPDGTLKFMNAAGRRLLPVGAEDADVNVLDLYTPQARRLVENEGIPEARVHGVWTGETVLRGRDNEEIIASEIIVAHRGPSGRLLYFSTIARDISERKRIEARLAHLARFDTLTDLPNRDLLLDRLEQAIQRARRHRRILAVLFLDLDDFKSVNDTLGHAAGDELLRSVADRLADTLRAEDTVARLGGDEFVVIVEELSGMEQLDTVLGKIEALFRVPFEINGSTIHATASVGATVYTLGDDDAATLLRQADAAMYQAKAAGRDTHRFYSHELQLRLEDRHALVQDLRGALSRQELFLVYQPEVRVRTGQIVAVEALLRWRHPARGLVMPNDFIPRAEETGLIVNIGAWVLDEACRQCREWRDAGLADARVAVNVSARQFRRGDMESAIAAALERHRLPPCSLDIEITEGLMMENLDAVATALRAVSALGVTLSVDDFGTGYSSLAYLRELPLNRLKIDRSFVRPLPADPDSAAIVRSIISLAHHLGLEVVAEGVENAAQLAFLQSEGCDLVQGYLFSRPIEAGFVGRYWKQGFPIP